MRKDEIRKRLRAKRIQIYDHPRLVLKGTFYSVWKKPDGGYIKTYEVEPEMEATYPSEQQVWRWLKLYLTGLPCRGIGMAGLELIEKHMAREEAHA